MSLFGVIILVGVAFWALSFIASTVVSVVAGFMIVLMAGVYTFATFHFKPYYDDFERTLTYRDYYLYKLLKMKSDLLRPQDREDNFDIKDAFRRGGDWRSIVNDPEKVELELKAYISNQYNVTFWLYVFQLLAIGYVAFQPTTYYFPLNLMNFVAFFGMLFWGIRSLNKELEMSKPSYKETMKNASFFMYTIAKIWSLYISIYTIMVLLTTFKVIGPQTFGF